MQNKNLNVKLIHYKYISQTTAYKRVAVAESQPIIFCVMKRNISFNLPDHLTGSIEFRSHNARHYSCFTVVVFLRFSYMHLAASHFRLPTGTVPSILKIVACGKTMPKTALLCTPSKTSCWTKW